MFPSGIEPETFCVLGRCDNHYTTETDILKTFNVDHHFPFDQMTLAIYAPPLSSAVIV